MAWCGMIRGAFLAFLLVLAPLVPGAHAAPQAASATAPACVAGAEDDTILPYSPALHDGALRAFHELFPGAPAPPEAMLAAQARFRCMGGRMYACFIGANLPCGKISTSPDNAGASAFCREKPDAAIVPMVATGHDTLYDYRCRDGRAVVVRRLYQLDARGFARRLWAPMDGSG
jgi:hypothetical protein